jgi:hypothetical protein
MTAYQHAWKGRWHPVLLAGVAFGLSVVALKALPIPYLWIGFIWALVFLGAMACLSKPFSRALFFLLFNASLVAAMFAVTEAYFYWREDEPVYSDGYRSQDDVLGFVPISGVRAHSSKMEGGKLLYNVTYSIDSNGLRIPPPANTESPSACIAFFGDSFTFGEGLEDNETLAYQVAVQSGGRFRTFNFGFHGYGPHQMLAAVEYGVVRRVVNCRPDYAIYQAIPDHAARVAGKVPYGKHAPRYQLTAAGDIGYAGHFDDDATWLMSGTRQQFIKSAMYRWLQNVTRSAISDDDVHLMLAIVRRTREQLAAQYPGIQFHVILWINSKREEAIYQQLQHGLRELSVPVHLVEDILPGYRLGASNYVLSDKDRHPTALANRTLASYVVTKIVKEQPAGSAASR